nr:hypothetical protein [Tanacetum cinerariifolium]
MEKGSSGDGGLKLQVCQLAEMKTFEDGFRGAWFRCKINDVDFKKNKILLEYYDFEEDERPPVNSLSEICVVIDDAWKVGDMVDWYKDDCYWAARVIKVLSNDKVQ